MTRHNFTTALLFSGRGNLSPPVPRQARRERANSSTHNRDPTAAQGRASNLQASSAAARPQPPPRGRGAERAERPLTHAKSQGSMGPSALGPSRRAAGRAGRGWTGAGSGGAPPHIRLGRPGGPCGGRSLGSAVTASPVEVPAWGGGPSEPSGTFRAVCGEQLPS